MRKNHVKTTLTVQGYSGKQILSPLQSNTINNSLYWYIVLVMIWQMNKNLLSYYLTMQMERYSREDLEGRILVRIFIINLISLISIRFSNLGIVHLRKQTKSLTSNQHNNQQEQQIKKIIKKSVIPATTKVHKI